MTYIVQVDVSPAYELIVSLYTYVNKPLHKSVEGRKEWVKETRAKLSPLFAEALEDERLEVLHRIVLLISQAPGERSTRQVLHWLQEMHPGEMYERMMPWAQSFSEDMRTVKERILYVLSEWEAQYYRHVEPQIVAELERSAADMRARQQEVSAVDLIEQATNGLRYEWDAIQRVILVPQVHGAPYSIVDHFDGLMTCLYPVDVFPTEKGVPRDLLRVARAVADENRLQILRFLAEGPRTFTEVVKHLQLVKSNVHYHLGTLRTAGLIRAHYRSERVDQYSLREEVLAGAQGELLRWIKG